MATLNIKGFPDDLYELLANEAKKEHRSLSGEVIYLLQWAVEETEMRRSSILQLRGLGKKRWKGINATKHVNKERDSWE